MPTASSASTESRPTSSVSTLSGSPATWHLCLSSVHPDAAWTLLASVRLSGFLCWVSVPSLWLLSSTIQYPGLVSWPQILSSLCVWEILSDKPNLIPQRRRFFLSAFPPISLVLQNPEQRENHPRFLFLSSLAFGVLCSKRSQDQFLRVERSLGHK